MASVPALWEIGFLTSGPSLGVRRGIALIATRKCGVLRDAVVLVNCASCPRSLPVCLVQGVFCAKSVG
jgi:hypothetical protein